MTLASPRVVFVVLFALNCVLWSSSRYGQIPHTSFLHGENSLVKRISFELANPNASILDAGEKQVRSFRIHRLPCADVSSVGLSRSRQSTSVLMWRHIVPYPQHSYLLHISATITAPKLPCDLWSLPPSSFGSFSYSPPWASVLPTFSLQISPQLHSCWAWMKMSLVLHSWLLGTAAPTFFPRFPPCEQIRGV